MTATPRIKPTHKPIKAYYAALADYAAQGISHEGAVRSAFQNLLAETGRPLGWTLIPELSDTTLVRDSNLAPTAAGSRIPSRTHSPAESFRPSTRIRPDATFRDEFFIERGHWEAKDTNDDLDAEIKKKIRLGYPLKNIIFEDTRQARLFQDGKPAGNPYDLTKPQELADLLNAFFGHVEPAHENFEKAVAEFKLRVPDLARGLVEIINKAHRDNQAFIAAFAAFFDLCRSSLNPNLSQVGLDGIPRRSVGVGNRSHNRDGTKRSFVSI